MTLNFKIWYLNQNVTHVPKIFDFWVGPPIMLLSEKIGEVHKLGNQVVTQNHEQSRIGPGQKMLVGIRFWECSGPHEQQQNNKKRADDNGNVEFRSKNRP